MGILWICAGLLQAFTVSRSDIAPYIFIAIGILYLSWYVYRSKVPYIQVKGNKLVIHNFWRENITLTELCHLEENAGRVYLKTHSKKIRFQTYLIEPQASEELLSYLRTER